MDNSLKSFLFSLKNPRNTNAMRFGLKENQKSYAISCDAGDGPAFGNGRDIRVLNDCNLNTDSYTNFGDSYQNDTGLDGQIVLTGAHKFKVREIEVFEIGD
jgi:hypothetical protein